MGRSAADEKILSYNDVVLRRSDLDILSGPYYLNDRIIEFYFSYLSSIHTSEDVLLVSPSIAFWIANCPDVQSLKDSLEPLKLANRRLVMFPVNDNNDVNLPEGGSHWSLLVYWRNQNVFVHHDSYGATNERYARQLYRVVDKFLGTSDTEPEATYMEFTDSPQQVNGYDCGLYVTAIAKAICHWLETWDCKQADDMWFSAVKGHVTPYAVADMRAEILVLIKGLAENK